MPCESSSSFETYFCSATVLLHSVCFHVKKIVHSAFVQKQRTDQVNIR